MKRGYAEHAGQNSCDVSPRSWRTVACIAGCLILAFILTFGLLAIVGDYVHRLHPVAAVIYWIIVAGTVIVGIIVPIFSMLRRPILTLDVLRRPDGTVHQAKCRAFVRQLSQDTTLTWEEHDYLQRVLHNMNTAPEELSRFYRDHYGKIPAEEAASMARTTFWSTALSQSSLIDGCIILVHGFRLIAGIVQKCGSRPTTLGILKLYIQVLGSALLIGGLEESDIDEILTALLGAGTAAKATGILASVCLQGMGGAFLMFRIAALTENALFNGMPRDPGAIKRNRGYARAVRMMRETAFVSNLAKDIGHAATSVASKAAGSIVRKVSGTKPENEICRN